MDRALALDACTPLMLTVKHRKSIWVFTQFFRGKLLKFYSVYGSSVCLLMHILANSSYQTTIEAARHIYIFHFEIQYLTGKYPLPNTIRCVRFVWCELHNLKYCFVFTFDIALCSHWALVKMVFLCAKMMFYVCVCLTATNIAVSFCSSFTRVVNFYCRRWTIVAARTFNKNWYSSIYNIYSWLLGCIEIVTVYDNKSSTKMSLIKSFWPQHSHVHSHTL